MNLMIPAHDPTDDRETDVIANSGIFTAAVEPLPRAADLCAAASYVPGTFGCNRIVVWKGLNRIGFSYICWKSHFLLR